MRYGHWGVQGTITEVGRLFRDYFSVERVTCNSLQLKEESVDRDLELLHGCWESTVTDSKSVHEAKFFISSFERAFKVIKNGVYFIVIALLVAELFKILVYAN